MYGINKILEPFVHDLSVLHTTGVTVEVKFDLSYTFKGALLAFLADILANHLLGGFKLSFSFAFRSCRTCMLPTSDFSKHVVDDECVLRNTQSHLQQCKLIEGLLAIIIPRYMASIIFFFV